MGRNNIVGAWGESLAAAYLQKKKFKVLASGYRSRFGEIDLIVSDKKFLVFVEVKTLARIGLFRPINNYSYRQNKRNILAAKSYIMQLHIPVENIRFDFIEVVGTPLRLKEIRHYQNFTIFPQTPNFY